MALSDSLTTNKYDSNRYYELTWSATQSTANNKSTIKWTLSAINDNGGSGYYAERTLKVTIDGSVVYSKTDRVERTPGTVTSGTITLSHKVNGARTFKAKVEVAVYGSSVNVEGEKTFTLDTIPRYFSGAPRVLLVSKTETTATFKWVTTENCSWVRYYLDNSASWVDVFNGGLNGGGYTPAEMGEFTVSGLGTKTSHSIYIECARADSGLWNTSESINFTTYDYPYCTETADFKIGDTLTLKFYNPLKRSVTVTLLGENDSVIDIYEGLTEETLKGYDASNTKARLYESIPNSTSGTYKVRTDWNGYTWTTAQGKRYSINERECVPTFNDFRYKDVREITKYLTEDDQVLVKGQSKVSITVPTHLKMVTKNGATPVKYVASLDGVSAECQYSGTEEASMTIDTVSMAGSRSLEVRAYDSRGLSYSVVKNIYVYDYEQPVINAKAVRLNDYETETTLSVSGDYWGFGICSLQNVQYQYREIGGEWTRWWDLSTTKSNGKYTCSDVVLALDNSKPYEINISASDNLTNSNITIHVDVGKATFFMCTNKKMFYVADKPVLVGTDETNYAPVDDYVVERGVEKSFVWKKFKSGDFEMRGLVTATDYKSAYVLECGFGFPIDLVDNAIGIVTLNEYSTNTNDLQRNAKISCKNNSATVTVHNASGAFIDGSTANVMVYIWGRWK